MVAALTINEKGEWCLADETDQVFRALVEYSKSSRASCRACKEKIEKDTLRIGKPIKWKTWISSWRHPECFWADDEGGPIVPEECFNFSSVTKQDDVDALLQALARTSPPDVDESLNPESADFEKAMRHTEIKPLPTPRAMTTQLLPFQEEALGWLTAQEENTPSHSGLLCDEMGMGKTIQTISLIVHSKPKSQGPTLIVAPSSAMLQWYDEAVNSTLDGTLDILVYHGNKRGNLTPADVIKHDIVLTSYPILEYEYRRCVDRCKVVCRYCDRKFLPRKLIVHNQYFCGPYAKRTEKLAMREKKNKAKETMSKAMKTLNIGKSKHMEDDEDDDDQDELQQTKRGSAKRARTSASNALPTPSNIYRELMKKANREPISMYTSRAEAKRIQELANKRKAPVKEQVDQPNSSKRMRKKESKPPVVLDRSSEDESEEEDEEDEKNIDPCVGPLNQSLWCAHVDGEYLFIVRPTTSSKAWQSNLLTSDGVTCYSFTTISTKKAGPESLKLKCDQDPEVMLSISTTGEMEASVDKGASWTTLSDFTNAKWVGSSVHLDEAVLNDGWGFSGKHMGSTVGRKFDKSVFLGVVFAHAPKQKGLEELWRVQHYDGDMEDLDRKELMEALKLGKAWKPEPSNSNGAKKNAKPTVNQLLEFNLTRLKNSCQSEMQASSSKKTPKQTPKRSVKKGRVSANRKKRKDQEAEDEEEEDDDSDSDFTPDNDKGVENNEEDEDYEEEEEEEEEEFTQAEKEAARQADLARTVPKSLKPRFVPVTWGPGSSDAKMLAQCKLKELKALRAKQKKQRKKQKKSSSKKTKGKQNGKQAGKGNTKKSAWSDDESSESSDDAESEDEIELDQERWKDGMFWFAPPGDVVDDDGIDLGPSLLHCIGWYRIVLDEAHKIKDRVNSTAKSTLALRAPAAPDAEDQDNADGGPCRRWALTGTPLQNRIGELYSLIRFLRIDPFAYYCCKTKDCQCKSLHWGFGREGRVCDSCGHPPMQHYSYFNQSIVNPIKRNGYIGEGKHAMKLLRDQVLGKLMLRRTKAERQKDIQLPPSTVEVKYLNFSPAETDFYSSLYLNTQAKFGTFVEKGTLLHNFAHIFELLSRLRRACDHPYLVVHADSEEGAAFSKQQTYRADVCAVCGFGIESLEECAVGQCKHTFHKECLSELFESYKGGGGGSDIDAEDEELAMATTGRAKHGANQKKAKKKGTKRARSGKGKDETLAEAPNCPTCFLPLSVMLDIKGGSQSNESGVLGPGADDDDSCVICLDRKRDCLLVPCGHLFICMECGKNLEQRHCPMCRAEVKRMIRVDPNTTAPSSSATSSSSSSSSHSSPTITSSLNAVKASSSTCSTSASAVSQSEQSEKTLAEVDKAKQLTNDLVVAKGVASVVAGARTTAALLGRKSILQRIDLKQFSSSAKVDGVIEEVELMLKDERKDTDMPNKAIVFSQYKDMLDIVEWRLKSQGIGTVKLVGSMGIQERRAVLAAFKTSEEVRVILMSLKAGGEGLNLQEASHVFVLEPWWNPAVEMQAIQRAHRIGQKRSVRAVRFVTKDSIEEKMMQLQEKKMLVFEGAVDGSQAALSKLTEEDLRFLFS